MNIIQSARKRYSREEPNSLVSLKTAQSILSHDNEFVDEVFSCFSIDKENDRIMKEPLQVGNVSQLLADIDKLDQQSRKMDAIVNLKDIRLEKVLENDRVLFHLFGIADPDVIKEIQADHLIVESSYSARSDIMEYYQFGKFASFLHSNKMDEYAKQIWDTLRHNTNNNKKCMARLLYHVAEDKYYVRAVASENGYKKYGVNFSILVLLLAVNDYVKSRKERAFVESYVIDDSNVLVSIQLSKKIQLEDDMYLTVNLSLENDEIRQSAVTLNAEFRVVYKNGKQECGIYIKPTAYQKQYGSYSQDMLTYTHGMNVKTAVEKISSLPFLIDKYIDLVSKNAIAIKSIRNPQQVKEFITQKIQHAKKEEFIGYKKAIVEQLTRIDVHSVFELFELLRNVEDLFGEDIRSKNFWRQKLYDALINRGKDE